jgi:hypothetical protein
VLVVLVGGGGLVVALGCLGVLNIGGDGVVNIELIGLNKLCLGGGDLNSFNNVWR